MGPVERSAEWAEVVGPGLTRRRLAWDLLLAGVCTAVAVVVQVTGLDAIPANRPPDVWSVLFTVAAVGPLAARRRAPLAVLVGCLPGLLALVAGRYQVGAASLGFMIAFYTVAAWGSPRDARRAIGVLIAGAAALIALRPIDLSVEGALSTVAVLLGGWVVGTGHRDRRAAHAAEVAEAERRIGAERERAAVQERLRLSRELHDILGHAMSVMVVQAGVAEHLLDSRPDQAREAIARIGRTGRASLDEMRRLLAGTRVAGEGSSMRPQPQLADLPALVAQVGAAGLPVQIDQPPSGPEDQIPSGIQLAAYRVIQEALTNTLKHAGPAQARIRLSRAPGALQVEILDTGTAAQECSSSPAQPGHGLIGMRERVTAYGGTLVTGPEPGGGFGVRARFPLAGDVLGEPA